MIKLITLKVKQLLNLAPNKILNTKLTLPPLETDYTVPAGTLTFSCHRGLATLETWTMYHPPSCYYPSGSREELLSRIVIDWIERDYKDVHRKLKYCTPKRLFVSWEKVVIKPREDSHDIEFYGLKLSVRDFEGLYLGI